MAKYVNAVRSIYRVFEDLSELGMESVPVLLHFTPTNYEGDGEWRRVARVSIGKVVTDDGFKLVAIIAAERLPESTIPTELDD